MDWPKAITAWQIGQVGFMSVPFTWLLPEAKGRLLQDDAFIREWCVGGPATALMPDYLAGLPHVTIGAACYGVLQRVNPLATRTTVGCPNRCPFCAVPRIEGEFRELEDWPDLPLLCDNNLLASSRAHLERVFDRLMRHEWCDFNQGLDVRRIGKWEAEQICQLPNAMCRIALDNDGDKKHWLSAVECLCTAGVPASRIRSYCLVGFSGTPTEDWKRCEFVNDTGIKPLPMWFHALNSLDSNVVTVEQEARGWSDIERRRLMGWYYKHRGTKPDLDQDGDVDLADFAAFQNAMGE